ncbi:uncharacterized protein FOMMEDRAFT_143803 [Fomitiporia mediterranea MF3/22]|uniref:uncharacterized protein n=1 Tax=Fomitiporia mediterranea (strain MF3/22) TaxID=694068 RepID=UPI0004407955|nr:uncharacterized protein FOMMEDRAFT_143803 [Fomitiporia mediterranea MF3/22]EJD07366.1 hypothetical protein FOMMEDRAFT_143803 [Fomitiporia mediterranea MF3/22]
MLLQVIVLFLCSIIAQVNASMSNGPQRRDGTSKKAGLGWDEWNNTDASQYTGPKIGWYYTWSPWYVKANVEFVPMFRAKDQLSDFQKSINATISSKQVKAVLAFNEPDQSSQAHMPESEALTYWNEHILPLKSQGVRIGTPAVSSNPSGKQWFQNWWKLCNNQCHPDFLAVHWYGNNATEFQHYLEDFHSSFGNLPVWVTEWADKNFKNDTQPSVSEVADFLTQTTSYMDKTSWIERYAYFGTTKNLRDVPASNAMMDKNGKITALGKQYIGGSPGSTETAQTTQTSHTK